MAVTVKSADAGLSLAFNAGTTTHDLTVSVAAGELLILALYGQGTINSVSESVVNANGEANLDAYAEGRFSTRLWVFTLIPDASVTTITLNVTGFYAEGSSVVFQGDNLEAVDVSAVTISPDNLIVNEDLLLDAGTATASGTRVAIGLGQKVVIG